MRILLVFIAFIVFGFSANAQTDARVESIYTLAKIPMPLGVYKHVVQAKIINKGTTPLSNLPVTLNVTGANSFSNVQFANILPDDTAIINFSAYSPWNPGNNTIAVSVPADDNNSNNNASYTQLINTDTYSYADNSVPVSSIGYGTGEGMLLTRYNVSGSAVVKKVRVFISDDASNIGNTVYGVVVNFGTILGQSDPHIITAAELNTYVEFDIPNPPTVDFDFYAGLLQTTNASLAYYPVAFQNESLPTRTDAYYGAMSNGSGLTSLSYFGRLMIQAVVDIGSVTPFNSSASSPYKVIAGWDFSGAQSPNSFTATTYDTLLSSSNQLTRSAQVPPSPGLHSFRSAGFQNNGISVGNQEYFEFSLSPKPGDTLQLNSISGYTHGFSDDISNNPVLSRFAYSFDAVNFTLIGSNFITNSSIKNFSVSLASIAALQQIVNGTTVTFRYYASGASAAEGWGFVSPQPGYDGLAINGRLVTSNTITVSPVEPTNSPYSLFDCGTTASGSVSFTSTGVFEPGNEFFVELGQMYQPHFNVYRFKFPVIAGSLQTNANSGVINFTIPQGTNAFDPYAIRIISTKPYTTSSFSQPFSITADYCKSQPTDLFRSKISGNWNDNQSWESSSDGNTWIPSTLVPDENATNIEIRSNDTINIVSNVIISNTTVKGTLRLLNGNGNGNKGLISLLGGGFPINLAMKIDTAGTLQVISTESKFADAFFYLGGRLRVYGKIMIGDGNAAMAGGFDKLASDNTGNINWLAGSVFEWNSDNGAGPVENNYFPDGNEASTFRITKIPGGTWGNDQDTYLNGLLEVNTPVTLEGTGVKYFRDGINGRSTLLQDNNTGTIIVSSPFEEIPATPVTNPAVKGILAGTVHISLNNGLTLENGARIPDSSKVVINGPCTSLQLLELTSGAELTLDNTAVLTMNDADLRNAGLIKGDGLINFTGSQDNELSSPGLITAPVTIDNKQLHLGTNSNTTALSLVNNSNVSLGLYDLNMIGTNAALVADSMNFFVTNDTGRLNRYIADQEMLYPVGTSASSYTPVSITNSGNEDYVKVRVAAGVEPSLTTGNVDRTWFIGDTAQTGLNLSCTARWTASEEQAGFDRNSCYIAHYTVCSNCSTGFYDAVAMGAANGTDAFTISRNGIGDFRSNAFIVTSRPFVYTFTGSGDWNDVLNWSPAIVAPTVIPSGIEVVIDGVGQCDLNGDLYIQNGGILTVKPNKALNITGNLTSE